MSFEIIRMDDYGRGITYKDGKICFISNSLIGEEIDFEITDEKSKYIEGIASNIKNRSIERIEPKCPYFLKCGGCNIMHMNYDAQLLFKKKKIENILSRFAKLDNLVKEIISTKEFIYRNKVVLKVLNGKIGYYKNNSNELVEIDKCLLARGAINETIKILKRIDLKNVEEVILRSNHKSEVLLCLKGHDIDTDYLLDRLYKVDNIVVIDNDKKTILKGEDFIIDKIGNMFFKLSLESFFQVNSFGVEILYEKVKEYANLSGEEIVLDLYCGTGTIGIFLSEKAKQVYGIEINEKAVLDANYNKKLNHVNNISFSVSDVGQVKEDFKDIDLVVIDPPRSGLSKAALNNVLDIEPKKIIYVSCDPITLARDLDILKQSYSIKEITAVDMFPNTYHVECVSVLTKKN